MTQVVNGQATELDTLRATVAALQAKLAAKSEAKAISFKVTAKKEDGSGTDGAISAYGLGRFPVTLYAGQWERLMAHADALKAFIAANSAIISRKQ